MDKVKSIFESLMERYPQLDGKPIWMAFECIRDCYMRKGKLLVCGNGGSSADSEHIVGELMKGFLQKRELSLQEKEKFSSIEGGEILADKLQMTLSAISLSSQEALLTAIGNDNTYEMVFAQQVYGYGEEGDVLLAMSASGKSKNVVAAIKTAKVKKMEVILITGNVQSPASAISNLCIWIPFRDTYRIQEYTVPVYHALSAMLEAHFFMQTI